MNRNIELFGNPQWGLFVNLAAEKISTQLNFNKILIGTINISAVTFVVIDLSSRPELLKYLGMDKLRVTKKKCIDNSSL